MGFYSSEVGGIEMICLDSDYIQAQREYDKAWENFNNADSEYIEIAIKLLNAATEKLDAVIAKASISQRGPRL